MAHSHNLNKVMHLDVIPKVLVFSISEPSIQVNKKISFHDDGSLVVFGLKGVVIMVICIILLKFVQVDLYGSMMAWFLVGNAHMKKD
jgi:hypothetical protein